MRSVSHRSVSGQAASYRPLQHSPAVDPLRGSLAVAHALGLAQVCFRASCLYRPLQHSPAVDPAARVPRRVAHALVSQGLFQASCLISTSAAFACRRSRCAGLAGWLMLPVRGRFSQPLAEGDAQRASSSESGCRRPGRQWLRHRACRRSRCGSPRPGVGRPTISMRVQQRQHHAGEGGFLAAVQVAWR